MIGLVNDADDALRLIMSALAQMSDNDTVDKKLTEPSYGSNFALKCSHLIESLLRRLDSSFHQKFWVF